MSEFKISENLNLPREAVTWVISYLAKRGAGKTYCSSVQAEEMLKQNIPIVVVDGMGIWWGLRVNRDGSGQGLPIVVFGGEHADLPLVPEKAAEMAKAIVDSNISCVLDLSTFSKYMVKKILVPFLNELYRLNRAERHVFIEESDMWAPQKPIGTEEQLCLSAVDNFVRRGGNHNLGCTLITQRSAVLNKDILTQSDCLVILRTLAPQDKKAIQGWVEEQTDEDKRKLKEWYDSLKSLENGEGWVWHPEKPTIYQKVKFRQRETFHATREFIRSPQAGKIVLMDVDDFIQKFKRVFEPKPIEQAKPTPIEMPIGQIVKREPPKLCLKCGLPTDLCMCKEKEQEEKRIRIQETEQHNLVLVNQTLPNIRLQQFKPTLNLSVETLNEPTTPLGKAIVILVNGSRPDRWTGNKIKEEVRNHGWNDEGVDEVVNLLIRWEILKRQSNNYLYFFRKRIEVVENNGRMMVN